MNDGSSPEKLIIGTRGSPLALAQANEVKNKLLSFSKIDPEKVKIEIIKKYLIGKMFEKEYDDYLKEISIISKNKLLDSFSYQQIKGKLVTSDKNYVIKNGTPKLIKKLKGKIAILCQGASGYNNYAHCLLDIIPKIKLIY